MCAHWVLSDELKTIRMMCNLTFLHRYQSDGQPFIDNIVKGDESWIHHFVLRFKKATMVWKHPGSPTTKKFKATPSGGTVTATIFWDSCGVILIDYLEHDQTINADLCCAPLTWLCETIRRK
ncbi:histone-lysine N-methyltransferase SETMAR [Trichonephila clavata]|uniref:Histone-lysine N-methyltransferase SETMAR n=1 Tax=Trichonephila clavata TaxID=2740835 RepID=A0A8X6EWV2_TRICU|nr:histone-lysine N-methyltransferase SETMAR [Trichonephila clavata]